MKRERIEWAGKSEDDSSLSFLPGMLTDISIRVPGRTLIVEAKFYQESLQRYFEAKTIHSKHLYQLFAYLKNLECRGGEDASAEGVLLYPQVTERLRLRYELGGHRVRIHTVDLANDWRRVRQELLELVK